MNAFILQKLNAIHRQKKKKKKAVSMEFTKKKSSAEVSSTYLSALKNTVGKGHKRCYKIP